MSDLLSSPTRIVALVVAVAAIVPASVLILRMMRRLTPSDATPAARALDAVWTLVPMAGLVALVALAATA